MINRCLFVLIIIIVLFSSLVATAQLSMPDHTYVGATKQYWVNSNLGSGSTFIWKIDHVIQQNGLEKLFSVTWNNEGTFFVEVQETSESNCWGETMSGWVYVRAVPVLEITAPPIVVLCAVETVPAYSDFDSFIEAGGSVSDNCVLDSASFRLSYEEITGDHYPGPYTIIREYTLDDYCGNTSKFRQVINVPGVLSGSITLKQNVLCSGENTGSITLEGSGGTAPYTYRIDEGESQTTGIFNDLTTGVHSLTIVDSNGCTTLIVVTLTAENYWPEAAFSPSYIELMTYSFIDYSTNATTYFWDFGDGSTSAIANPSNAYTATGTYTVSLTVSNNCGTDSTSQKITIEIPDLEFYDGFSPNNDGLNDTWVIPILGYYPINNVKIINRWGSEVWMATNYNNANNFWNGQNMNGKDMPDGTYYFVINYNNIEKRGWVFIKR
jgi:gliding motility-associated-like protein